MRRDLSPGVRVDRYEMVTPIGEGGMATVWVARQHGKHGFQKIVAFKSILTRYAENANFRAMLLDEARIASHIEHPNVCQILDVGEEGDLLYLVLEYVDGDALSSIHYHLSQQGQVFPLPIALRIGEEVCAGLHAAHELRDADGHPLGVVHRDVSPQNILLGVRGDVKVIDFGIALARDRMTEETSHGSLKGKVNYMPPEQADGRRLDGRADAAVIALGSIAVAWLGRAGGKDPLTVFASLSAPSSRSTLTALSGHWQGSLHGRAVDAEGRLVSGVGLGHSGGPTSGSALVELVVDRETGHVSMMRVVVATAGPRPDALAHGVALGYGRALAESSCSASHWHRGRLSIWAAVRAIVRPCWLSAGPRPRNRPWPASWEPASTRAFCCSPRSFRSGPSRR